MTAISGRGKIFKNIANALANNDKTAFDRSAAAMARIAAGQANTVPARGRRRDILALFIAEAERVDATTAMVGRAQDLPRAVAAYLNEHNLPARLRASPRELLKNIAWSKQQAMEVTFGASAGDDRVGLSVAFSGVAESGTLVLHSGADDPTTLNFLPDYHLVVLPLSALVGTYEETWAALTGGGGVMPRTVNWITGPSRSADIEQTLLMGAHGPRFLHILILDDKKAP